MNDVTIIDRFLDTFSRYIDSGFGLLQGEMAFLTATLIAIDMTIAGLYWALGHASGQGDDVIAKLLRKVLYIGAFAYIINNFNWLSSIVFKSFAGLGLTAIGSTLMMENFLQPGHLAKTGINAGAPLRLCQISQCTYSPNSCWLRCACGHCASSDSRYFTQPRINCGQSGTTGWGAICSGSNPHRCG